jgi:Mn2+/Fe2+ NRAMP family transporter
MCQKVDAGCPQDHCGAGARPFDRGAAAGRLKRLISRLGRGRAVVGPGVLVMLADADAGNVVAAADAGAQWGYRLLPLLALAIPALYLFQELTIRLAIAHHEGFAESVARVFGRFSAGALGVVLFVSGVGNLVAQFSGVAGVGDLWGAPRFMLLGGAALAVALLLATDSTRRIERIALAIALFELAFFLAAWRAAPALDDMVRHVLDQPLTDARYQLSAAALAGAVFNPWMIFYQQSAVAERGLTPADLQAERAETCLGAFLTQALTAAMLISGAALAHGGALATIGEIAGALSPALGDGMARVVFSLGVLGASLTSMIVSSLTIIWALGEALGRQHHAEGSRRRPFRPVVAAQGAAILAVAFLVAGKTDLVWLNIVSQALNALLLPLVLAFLFVLARKTLPDSLRPHPLLWIAAVAGAVAVSGIGLFGGLAGLGG